MLCVLVCVESGQESYPSTADGVPIAVAVGKLTVKVTIRQAEADAVPRVEVDGFLGTVHLLLSPQQLHTMQEIAKSLVTQGSNGPWGCG